jgi:hypothetical protein
MSSLVQRGGEHAADPADADDTHRQAGGAFRNG